MTKNYKGVQPLHGSRLFRLSADPKDALYREMVWGPVIRVHEIGPYSIVEFLEDRSNFPLSQQKNHGRTMFQIFIDGKCESYSTYSLDDALIAAIAIRNTNKNSGMHIAPFVSRMLCTDLEPSKEE